MSELFSWLSPQTSTYMLLRSLENNLIVLFTYMHSVQMCNTSARLTFAFPLLVTVNTDIVVFHLPVSEESSYSSDNTEPEDDCRGCQLQ